MKTYIRLMLVSLMLLAPVLRAEDTSHVEAFQMPAWYERDGNQHALRLGMKLRSSDVVTTGHNSRVLIKLEEGSLVKLGERARLSLDEIVPPQQQTGIFEAVMKVTRGAFRFTTATIAKLQKRKVKVHIGALTIGIRGTDFWGSSKDDGDVLVLLEGKISAQRDGEAAVLMDDPGSLFVAPPNQPSLPLQMIDKSKLSAWAAETELQAEAGVIRVDGSWSANLMSSQNENALKVAQQKLDTDGYAGDIVQVLVNGQTWYRLRVAGFETRADAQSFANSINNSYGVQGPWVGAR